MREQGTNIILYAHDAVIYNCNTDYTLLKTHLESLLLTVLDWSQQNYINLNIQKTKFCIYGHRSRVKKFDDTEVVVDGQRIFRCKHYNYLGVQLDECMTLIHNFNSI